MEFLIAGYAEINPQFVDCMSTVVVMLLLYNKKGPQKKKNGNRLLPENMLKKKQEKDSPASNRRRRCSSGSSERPDRCQRSPPRKKGKNKLVYVSIMDLAFDLESNGFNSRAWPRARDWF